MNQKFIQIVSITTIIIAVLVSGYILLSPRGQNNNVSEVVPMVDGKQIVAMTVFAVSYSPASFMVKAGVPVKWEITSSGQPGCASGAIIANGLFESPVYLNPEQGQIKVVEFTPRTPGIYKFSCSMNMARGTIQVIN